MSNEFRGNGNLAENPAIKTVTVDGEERKLAEMRIFFDRLRQDGDGGLADKGGFWLDVTAWGNDLAERCGKLLRKGARLHVVGELQQQKWTSKESGEEKNAMQLNASEVYLGLSRVESVTYKERKTAAERDSEAA
ncbi:MAG: single-stranded DNA-binding protein [Pseudomonadota bacterium]